MLSFYSIFHLNLMYSSIEETDRAEVIESCYWPLFSLSNLELPIAIEAPGITLEIINALSPDWITELRTRVADGRIEFIGSGYSQIIGPIVPAKVNEWNQRLGTEVYEELLGIRPKLALVNEMAYSAGIVEHYVKTGYNAIIMEWNNPRHDHPEWKNEWRYYPQVAVGSNNQTIPVIWADSIAFQKFQRYVHGEYELGEYLTYLKSHDSDSVCFFPLYSNDVEIFDHRPGRFNTEARLSVNSEWIRIRDLFKHLQDESWCRLIRPSEVLDGLDSNLAGQELHLESPAEPIPVKKQEKYNINRWSLTGRDDFGINTRCHRLHQVLTGLGTGAESNDWKTLCYLWSSDFRTHITAGRWEGFLTKLEAFEARMGVPGFARAIADDKYEGDPGIPTSNASLRYESASLDLRLHPRRGYAIEACRFKRISGKALLGTIEHGSYDDIALSADFYSGHCVIAPPTAHKITDLSPGRSKRRDADGELKIHSRVETREVGIDTVIATAGDSLVIWKSVTMPSRYAATIHPLHITFIPQAWDRSSLYYAVRNGGSEWERYDLGSQPIEHRGLYSALISSLHSLGATDGRVIIGDREKHLLFEHDLGEGAMLPGITYLPIGEKTFFLRLIYSVGELDETFRSSEKPYAITTQLTITAHEPDETI